MYFWRRNRDSKENIESRSLKENTEVRSRPDPSSIKEAMVCCKHCGCWYREHSWFLYTPVVHNHNTKNGFYENPCFDKHLLAVLRNEKIDIVFPKG